MSDGEVYGIGLDNFILCPWFVAEYKYNEYATVINLIIANGINIENDWLIVAVIKKISLSKLILGGVAILAQHPINHIKDIVGIKDNRPFVSVILRVIVKL